MQTAHQLYVYGLKEMLFAEQQMVNALQEMEEMVSRNDLKKNYASHRAQTEKQVERLEQCLEEVGEDAEPSECKGILGLIEEFKTFVQEEDPSEDIIDVVSVASTAKVEAYEINSYIPLISLAEEMEHKKGAKLLGQNLKEEQQTLQKMETLREKVKPAQMGMEEEEEEGLEEMEGESEEVQTSNRSRSTKKSSSGRSRRAA